MLVLPFPVFPITFSNIFILWVINPFPNKPWVLPVCCIVLLKTLWEKEKLLETSNFSFSHSVFYPFGKLSAIFINFQIVVCKLFEFGRIYNFSFGKGLKLGIAEQMIKSLIHIITLTHYQMTNFRLVVLGFNATLTAKVISWRSVTHMCFLAFSHQY